MDGRREVVDRTERGVISDADMIKGGDITQSILYLRKEVETL